MSKQYHFWIKIQEGEEKPLICHATSTPEGMEIIIAKLEQALAIAKTKLSTTSTKSCPLCSRVMIQRTGTFGAFYVCSKAKCQGKRNGNGSIPQSIIDHAKPQEEVEDILDLLEIE